MHLTRFFLLSIFIYILVFIYCLLTFVDSIRASLVSLIHSSGSRTWKYENGIFVTTTRPVLCFFFRSCGCGKFINAREKSCNALACVRGFATNFLFVPPLQGAITDPERLHVGLYERKDAHRIASETSSRLLLVYNLLSMSSLLARVFFFFFFFMELPCIDVQLHFYLINDPLEILNY